MITRFLPSAFQYPFIHIPAQISIFYPIHQSLVVDLSAQLIEEADIQVKPFPVGIRTKRTGYFRLGISTYDFVGRTNRMSDCHSSHRTVPYRSSD